MRDSLFYCLAVNHDFSLTKTLYFYVVARTGTGPLCPFFILRVRCTQFCPSIYFKSLVYIAWLSCFTLGLLLFSPIVYDECFIESSNVSTTCRVDHSHACYITEIWRGILHDTVVLTPLNEEKFRHIMQGVRSVCWT